MPLQIDEEQLKELQEKIKNMSPEELKEFQKKQCIFCQIISSKIKSKKIYEDSQSVAILDINPANSGHVLLLPKEHYTIMPQIPEQEISHLFTVSKSISNSMLRGLESQGTNIIVANGIAAGQRAQHFVIHIIPRNENDQLQFIIPQKKIPEKTLDEIKQKLAKNIEAKPAKNAISKEPKKIIEAEFKDIKKNKSSKKAAKKNQNEPFSLDEVSKLLGV